MTMQRLMKTRLASLALLLVVLVSGFLLGVAWDRTQVATPSQGSGEVQDDDERDGRDRRGLIVEQVGLTAEQKSQVDSIVRYHREQMEALQDEVSPRYRAIVQTTRESIRGVLTDEQRVEYDSLLAEHDRRRRDRRDRDENGKGSR